MVTRKEAEKYLRLISLSWGRKQSGYVFFPWIDREVQERTGQRRSGFNEGPAFQWPKDRKKIIDHMLKHKDHDLYWTTSLFEYPIRREDVAMDEHALWADLDEVDPSTLDEYPPTIAWESSPGRYQCLWVAGQGDFQGASWPGNENQKMTYYIGADASGWDTVQLLRVPGWANHKPEYRKPDGTAPRGKLLWSNGPRYVPGDFADLPDISVGNTTLTDALEADIEAVDRFEVISRIRLKLNYTARELINAREVEGDRSDKLWYLIRCLADAGCSVSEIVAIVRETVWNKFRDRHDELRRLIAEASKAIAKKSDIEELDDEEEEIERADPQRLGFLLRNIQRPKYLINGILTEGACGFIAGEPKCYKSWVALDMALSVATGADFLGYFRVNQPGPVLYIQEEDPATTLKSRSAKIWVNKATDKMELVHTPDEAGLWWLPPDREHEFDPDINAYIQQGVVISSEPWQMWLDETLEKGMDGIPYKLLIIDTLMMTAGDVDENRSQEMTNRIFRPLKLLSRKHNVALLVVHHMGKADRSRPGQRLIGSVANHAWGEDSLYLSRSGIKDVRLDLESKTIPGSTYRITELDNVQWTPTVTEWSSEPNVGQYQSDSSNDRSNMGTSRNRRSNRNSQNEVIELLDKAGPIGLTTAQLAEARSVSRSTIHRQMTRLLDTGKIQRSQMENGSNRWILEN